VGMSSPSGPVGFDSVLDAGRLGRFQLGVIVPCALVAMIDGFDTQSIGLVAPDIAADWGVRPATFGLVFGIGLFGGLLGAFLFGLTSDRYGRKPNLLVAVGVFGVVTLLTPVVDSVPELLAVRFVTGLGLGGALPGIIALTSEYTPARRRATIVGLMFCGFPLGAVLGGLVAARLIPVLGWQAVFYVGGGLPLLLLPVLALRLPESARFLAMAGDHAGLGRILRRMGSPVRAEDIEAEPAATRSPVASLFTDGRAPGTLLLWLVMFLSLLLAYLLTNWIPIVARQTGVGAASAILGVAALNFGGILGCVTLGRLTDRSRRPTRVLAVAYVLGGLAIAAIGQSGGSGGTLLLACFVAGLLSLGAQLCTVALIAGFYETALRATGVGWSVGVGRIGGIVGPVLGGLLVAAGMGAPSLFLLTGLASVGAAVAMFALGTVRAARRASAEVPTERVLDAGG
ncbi:MAG TPA: MFS transporter, partial [Pseudonocardia sp.]|nr:MFS transporter [Pseudonocardia sp.]